MDKISPVVAIALALLITGFLHPLTEVAKNVVDTRAQHYDDFRHELRDSMGIGVLAATPFIEFPGTRLRGPDGALPRQPNEIRLYPKLLRVSVLLREFDMRRSGMSLPVFLTDIEQTAVFETPEQWDAYFPDDEPDWSSARIVLPVAQPKVLSGFPSIRINGQEWRLNQSLTRHNRMLLSHDIRELPQGPVTLSLQGTAAGPHIGIGAKAMQANVQLLSERGITYFSGPKPDEKDRAGGITTWNWSIDRSAYFDGVWDHTSDPRTDGNGGFLGIQLRDPDTSGSIELIAERTFPRLSLVAGSFRFLPAIFLCAAVAAIAAGQRRPRRQGELLLSIAAGAAVMFWLTQRVDQGLAFAVGGAVAAVGAAAFLAQHSRVAPVLAACVIAGLWIALYHVLGLRPEPGQLNYRVLPDIAQPFLIMTGAGLLLLVGLSRGVRRVFAR